VPAGCFVLGRLHAAPTLPGTHGSLLLSEYEVGRLPAPTLPGATRSLPQQEYGKRPRV
jgi:hypothetical protein